VTNIDSPFAPGNAGQVSSDGHSALVEFDIRGKSDDAKDKVKPILATVADAQRASPQFTIAEFGGGSVNKAIGDQFGKDLLKAGALSLPVTLVILLLVFGAVVAAGIPLLLALTSVLAAIGLLALPSHVLPMDDAVSAVVLLIGLAVGVDYSMFYLKRSREERLSGRTESASVEAAAATSGRSVLISGFTVMVAMAGMFISGDKTFEGFAAATPCRSAPPMPRPRSAPSSRDWGCRGFRGQAGRSSGNPDSTPRGLDRTQALKARREGPNSRPTGWSPAKPQRVMSAIPAPIARFASLPRRGARGLARVRARARGKGARAALKPGRTPAGRARVRRSPRLGEILWPLTPFQPVVRLVRHALGLVLAQVLVH
jgi:MMPL family